MAGGPPDGGMDDEDDDDEVACAARRESDASSALPSRRRATRVLFSSSVSVTGGAVASCALCARVSSVAYLCMLSSFASGASPSPLAVAGP